MKPRVLVTTVPFAATDSSPLRMLEAANAELVINPIGRRLREEELAEMIGTVDAMIAGTEPITARVLAAAPRLKLIARVGIGLDNVDLVGARARGIEVTYTPDAPSAAVAELAIALMIDQLRGITSADRSLRAGEWKRFMGRRLSQSTVGIIGVGRIGRLVIGHLTRGFPGVQVLGNDIAPDLAFGAAHGVEWAEKTEIFRRADVISLHVPLTPATNRLIDEAALALMRQDVVLVNTSRGNMIDEGALAGALQGGRVASAAIDVFSIEPYAGPLTALPNCILTCHLGSMSSDCRSRMEIEATREIVRFLKGEPLMSRVPEAEYAIVGGER